jgi:hypothetical protein
MQKSNETVTLKRNKLTQSSNAIGLDSTGVRFEFSRDKEYRQHIFSPQGACCGPKLGHTAFFCVRSNLVIQCHPVIIIQQRTPWF